MATRDNKIKVNFGKRGLSGRLVGFYSAVGVVAIAALVLLGLLLNSNGNGGGPTPLDKNGNTTTAEKAYADAHEGFNQEGEKAVEVKDVTGAEVPLTMVKIDPSQSESEAKKTGNYYYVAKNGAKLPTAPPSTVASKAPLPTAGKDSGDNGVENGKDSLSGEEKDSMAQVVLDRSQANVFSQKEASCLVDLVLAEPMTEDELAAIKKDSWNGISNRLFDNFLANGDALKGCVGEAKASAIVAEGYEMGAIKNRLQSGAGQGVALSPLWVPALYQY